MSSVIHCARFGARRVASAAAAAPNADIARARSTETALGSMTRCDSTSGPTRAPTSPDKHRNPIVIKNARPPSRAMCAASAPAMPTMTSDTTSGITVMRMAFTKSVPNGSTTATARSTVVAVVRLRSRPKTSPAVSARRTRVLRDSRDTRQSYMCRTAEQGGNEEGAAWAPSSNYTARSVGGATRTAGAT